MERHFSPIYFPTFVEIYSGNMDLNQKIPSYITEKRNIVRLILFTAFFALVFINIYSPFEVNDLVDRGAELLNYENRDAILLISSSLVILTGVLVVVLSRVILYHYTKRYGKIKLINFFMWIAIEILCMALFYALYERKFLNDVRPFFTALKVSVQNTALVLLLPYSISWLYFSWMDKAKRLERMRDGGDGGIDERRDMITFYDEKGTMRLTIKFSDLLYMQAADNYVNIYYNHQDKQSKYMLRSSLRLIEDNYKDYPITRCHRSYMVNFEKVQMIRREKDGLRIKLDSPIETDIPVSKTYMEDVFSAFGHEVV